MMKIIKRSNLKSLRKGSIPKRIKNNSDFTYGIPSNTAEKHAPGQIHVNRGGESYMVDIMSHTDNLRDDLHKRI